MLDLVGDRVTEADLILALQGDGNYTPEPASAGPLLLASVEYVGVTWQPVTLNPAHGRFHGFLWDAVARMELVGQLLPPAD